MGFGSLLRLVHNRTFGNVLCSSVMFHGYEHRPSDPLSASHEPDRLPQLQHVLTRDLPVCSVHWGEQHRLPFMPCRELRHGFGRHKLSVMRCGLLHILNWGHRLHVLLGWHLLDWFQHHSVHCLPGGDLYNDLRHIRMYRLYAGDLYHQPCSSVRQLLRVPFRGVHSHILQYLPGYNLWAML